MTLLPTLSRFLFLLLAIVVGITGWTCSLNSSKMDSDANQRNVVFLLERSTNTQKALAALNAGLAESFAATSGRVSDPFTHYIYSYTLDNDLEKVVTGSTDPDTVTGALKNLIDAPLTDCTDSCCCNRRFPETFETVLEAHLGDIIVVLLDCVEVVNKSVVTNWARRIENTNTVVLLAKLKDSYCAAIGEGIGTLIFTQFSQELHSGSFKGIMDFSYSYYQPFDWSGKYYSLCDNFTSRFSLDRPAQRITYFLYLGLVNRPWEFISPSGSDWTENIHYAINDPTGVQLVSIFAGCPTNWKFVRGKCVYNEQRRMDYESARENCQSMGASLVYQFSDDDLLAEDLFAADGETQPFGRELWLGLDDMNVDRNFRWSLWKGFISASSVNYTRWAPGQPSTSGLGSRCVSLKAKNEWAVTYCKSLFKSACIMPAYGYDVSVNGTDPLPTGYWVVKLDSYPSCGIQTHAFA